MIFFATLVENLPDVDGVSVDLVGDVLSWVFDVILVLGADAVLDGLRRKHVSVAVDHLVGVDPLVFCDIDGQRVVAQGLHFIGSQIAIGLISQHVVFTW